MPRDCANFSDYFVGIYHIMLFPISINSPYPCVAMHMVYLGDFTVFAPVVLVEICFSYILDEIRRFCGQSIQDSQKEEVRLIITS